jgi:molybdate transport system regulatory protein
MKISARNMLLGKVSVLKTGAVNAEVELEVPGGHTIVAVVTNESVAYLGLSVGSEAYALVKAPLVVVAKGKPDLKFSTRNVLGGTVKAVKLGTVNADVSIELAGGAIISAIITCESVQGMGLSVGDAATALFKASSVILAVKA